MSEVLADIRLRNRHTDDDADHSLELAGLVSRYERLKTRLFEAHVQRASLQGRLPESDPWLRSLQERVSLFRLQLDELQRQIAQLD